MDCLSGDLIFYAATPTSSFARRLVGAVELLFRWGSSTQYGHVAIAKNSQRLVEAVWPRVRERDIDWTESGIEVWRVVGVTTTQGEGAAQYACAQVGEWYGFFDYIFGLFPSKHYTICSVLAEDTWLSQQLDLAPNPSQNEISPDALVAGGKLIKVYG